MSDVKYRHRTLCYPAPNKQKPSTIPSRKYNNCVWDSVVQLVAKYLRYIESVETKKFKFELDKFLDLIPDGHKMPNYVTAARSNSIQDQLSLLGALAIYQGGRPRLCHDQA